MITIGVALYMARKRIRALARLGRLKHWLEFHIFLCTLGPFLVLLHTSFKFGGIVSIAFWSMVAVVASGVFGRYVYVWIPKTLGGQFLSLRELHGETGELLASLVSATGLAEADLRSALEGIGLAYCMETEVAEHLATGRLIAVLEDWCPTIPGFFLYYPSRRQVPAGLRALIELLCA